MTEVRQTLTKMDYFLIAVSMIFVLKIVNLLISGLVSDTPVRFIVEMFCLIVFFCGMISQNYFGKSFGFLVSLVSVGLFTLLMVSGIIHQPAEGNLMSYASVSWFYLSLLSGNCFGAFIL
ncbi:hypothetical protein HQ571_00080 [Candidatus Kuenenbacteria bacterium]|nr:hypothetical protein [Candidatus Kuenenbacteria bacterium]